MGLILALVIGGGLGAALGYFGKCNSGTCPLTANPWRGAVYGIVLGLIFHTALARNTGPQTEPSHNVKTVDEAQFDAEISNAARPVVVDFFATWCGPCKRLSPMLDQAATPLTKKVSFLKVDVDKSARLAERFNIQGVPTMLFFRNGKPVDRIVGLPSEAELNRRLLSFAEIKE